MRRETILWEGGRKALIYVPDALPKGQRHPILCFLHGAGENALDDTGNDRGIDIVANNGSPALHAAADMPFVRDFLVICPQLLHRGHWTNLHAAQVGALVDKVADERGGDRSRCHLTGFSYGGRGVFVFADADPVRWSSLWAVTPAVQKVTPPPARGKQVFLHFGEADEVISAQVVRDFVAKWPPAASGVRRVEKTLLSGIPPSRASHGHTSILAYMDPEPYAWLRAAPGSASSP
jgi:predicted peptidase